LLVLCVCVAFSFFFFFLAHDSQLVCSFPPHSLTPHPHSIICWLFVCLFVSRQRPPPLPRDARACLPRARGARLEGRRPSHRRRHRQAHLAQRRDRPHQRAPLPAAARRDRPASLRDVRGREGGAALRAPLPGHVDQPVRPPRLASQLATSLALSRRLLLLLLPSTSTLLATYFGYSFSIRSSPLLAARCVWFISNVPTHQAAAAGAAAALSGRAASPARGAARARALHGHVGEPRVSHGAR
jgi:hypothetical protein